MMMREGLTFDDVLLVPGYNDIPSRKDVDVSVRTPSMEVPIFSSNMDTVTGSRMAIAMRKLGGFGILHRFWSFENNVIAYNEVRDAYVDTFVSVGIGENGENRAHLLHAAGATKFCVDVAHGHTKAVGKMIKYLRDLDPHNLYIVAGNVATYAGADYLAGCGADAIKVGIGPGSVCTTRNKAGVGVPQLTAIADCSRVDRFIIADGGIRTSGDVVKAIAAGADAVMLGGMLAGASETPGEVMYDGLTTNIDILQPIIKSYKSYRGMASKEAQEDLKGGMSDWKTAEGVETKVPLRGSVENIIRDIVGGIRSGMTYVGASNLSELRSKAEFIRITNAGQIEGTPHGETM